MTQGSNYKNTTDSNTGTDYNTENITEDDKELLRLLDIQKCAQIIAIYADIIGYVSTLEGIELIYSKYKKNINSATLPNPDIQALQSVYLGLIARSMTTEIGFLKYNKLYKKYINGEITYSLKPNVDINIGNILGLVSTYYTLKGVKGIYKRDMEQPILGI